MLLNDIKDLVIKGKMILEEHPCGIRVRMIKRYSKIDGEVVEYPKVVAGKVVMVKKFLGNFIGYEKKTYKKIKYFARFPLPHSECFYRISKKTFNELNKYMQPRPEPSITQKISKGKNPNM